MFVYLYCISLIWFHRTGVDEFFNVFSHKHKKLQETESRKYFIYKAWTSNSRKKQKLRKSLSPQEQHFNHKPRGNDILPWRW